MPVYINLPNYVDSPIPSQNLFSSAIELGTITYPDGVPTDRDKRLRTVDATPLKAGTYTLVWTSDKTLGAYAFLYNNNFEFVQRYPINGTQSDVPLEFTIPTDGLVKFVWMGAIGIGDIDLVPSDLNTITLVPS